MAVFVQSKSKARRHGVFAMEKVAPAAVRASTGTGTVALVERFPWGPSQSLTFSSDLATQTQTFAPAGMNRTGSGYLSMIRKGFARLGIIRVLGTAAVAATATLVTGGTTDATVTLKYAGTDGNAVTWTISNASDGDANHFNLDVTISGASGVTTDTIKNINISGTGTDALPTAADYNRLVLVGAVTKVAAGRPTNGTGSFSTGTDGTIALAAWAGTQGSADAGIALLEADKTIDILIVGDPGNSLRATVNAAAIAHADFAADGRMAFINGPSGQTQAQAKTDKASYTPSINAAYIDVWAYINDDVDGTKRLVPPASFAAAVASQLPTSTSLAWKSTVVRSMLGGIVGLEVNRGDLAADNTDAGIVTLQAEDTGGYTFESAKNMAYAADPTRGSIKRTRMGGYIARAVVQSLRPYVDSPNVPENQQDELDAVDSFLGKLKAAKANANTEIHILDYAMADSSAMNTFDSLQAGEFDIGADITISADQEKIFFLMNYGENVKPRVVL